MLLIETAGEALAILSEEGTQEENADQFVRERALAFRELSSRYFSLVNVSYLSCCIQVFMWAFLRIFN